MIVVSDTTPIISLLKTNHLDLLEALYGKVRVPGSVYEELAANPKYQHEAETIRKADYIEISAVSNKSAVTLFRRATGLDAGESEAIILSDETHADLLLMDERKGRQVARQMGLTITGTIGILISAYDEKYLSADDVRQCIDELKRNGRHISEHLFEQLVERISK